MRKIFLLISLLILSKLTVIANPKVVNLSNRGISDVSELHFREGVKKINLNK